MARKASGSAVRALSSRRCFARSEVQARKAIQLCQQRGLIRSVGTHRNYETCLKLVCDYVKANGLGDLIHISRETAERYLTEKAAVYSQKTLDMHRHSLQALLRARNVLPGDAGLEVVKSKVETTLESRRYTDEQIERIANAQDERYALSTRLAAAAGLRAHELYTIHRVDEGRPADVRRYDDGSEKNLAGKFSGLGEGVIYLVTGKGGLTRQVFIPADLVQQLEARRLETPVTVVDRGVNYKGVVYDLAGGREWSRDFSAISTRALGWSHGAHGLRHSYAQNRMDELAKRFDYRYAKECVSQELGHFRASITDTYLR